MSQCNEQTFREKIQLLKDLCKPYQPSIEKSLKPILDRLENPFLITIFGEVKAGKSSFINALLGIPNLCKVDVDICTDKIYVIKYCPKEGQKALDELTEELCVNNKLLKGFVVVDTPGVNSILEHHTEITKRFLPQSDAIIVVLPADNPHTKTPWDWVKNISKDFAKKIVFVLQKSDLLKPRELEKIVKRVESYARESGVPNPKIFPVSALKELKGEPDSGFKELRNYLNEHFTGEKQKLSKLEGVRKELINLYTECLKKIDQLLEENHKLKERFEETLQLLKRKKKEALQYEKLLTDSVDNFVNRLSKEILHRLEQLSLVDITFRKGKVKNFLKEVEKYLEEELKRFIESDIVRIVELFEEGFLKEAVREFSQRVKEFETFLKKVGKAEVYKGILKAEKIEPRMEKLNLPPSEGIVALMGGSLLGGALVAALSGSFIVDITGGVIAALALSLGSYHLLRRKRQLEENIERVLRTELGEKLKTDLKKFVENRLSETLGSMEKFLEYRLKVLEEEEKELQKVKASLIKNLTDLRKMECV